MYQVITKWNPNKWWDGDPNNPRGPLLLSLRLGWWISPPPSWPELPWQRYFAIIDTDIFSVGKFNPWKLLGISILKQVLCLERNTFLQLLYYFLRELYLFSIWGVYICLVSTIIKLQTIQSDSWCRYHHLRNDPRSSWRNACQRDCNVDSSTLIYVTTIPNDTSVRIPLQQVKQQKLKQ